MAPKAKLLIVDDDPMMRRVLIAFARTAGHDFIVAANGAEGLITAETEPFMLIFTDFDMPRLNGVEMIEAIRDSCGPNAQTPVVMLTATDRLTVARRARCVGAADVMSKPITYDAFCAAVALYADPPANGRSRTSQRPEA